MDETSPNSSIITLLLKEKHKNDNDEKSIRKDSFCATIECKKTKNIEYYACCKGDRCQYPVCFDCYLQYLYENQGKKNHDELCSSCTGDQLYGFSERDGGQVTSSRDVRELLNSNSERAWNLQTNSKE
jgi:hypothetical protein